jgi:hypothetical protein
MRWLAADRPEDKAVAPRPESARARDEAAHRGHSQRLLKRVAQLIKPTSE